MSWRACLLASAIFLAGMSGGLWAAHVSQEPLEWYGSSEYWQRRALGYFREMQAVHARVARYDQQVRDGKCEAPQ